MNSNARRRVQRLGVVSLVAVLAAGCSAGSGADAPGEGETSRSGVGIVAEGCGLTASVGSGAVIDQPGGDTVVVTVAHTIKGATKVTVVDADGDEFDARVVAFDKDADLAALQVDGLTAPGLSIATGADIAGTAGSILTWGPDDGVESVPVDIVKRLIVTIEDIYIDEVVERTAVEIAGPVTGGDSGGPVLDEDGEVIGIIYANSRGREQVGFATDQHELNDLLSSVSEPTIENGTCF